MNATPKQWPRVRHLPEAEQEPFRAWLCGQARPWIEGLPDAEQDGYFRGDYDRWKEGRVRWKEGSMNYQLHQNGDEWQVWVPNMRHGDCIGVGKTKDGALADAVDALETAVQKMKEERFALP